MTENTALEADEVLTGTVIPGPGHPEFDPEVRTPAAPYGWTWDKKQKDWRPRKMAGRPKDPPAPPSSGGRAAQPSLDDLKDRGPIDGASDRSPDAGKARRKARAKAEDPLPPFRAGPIATGMNKLYARVGRIVRVMDPAIGTAIISTTTKESEAEVTVGEAWEEVARTNPRIRRVLLKLIEGGAWAQLFMAHAPILIAVLMKPSVISKIPFTKFLLAYVDEDDQAGDGLGAAMADLTEDDVRQAADLAQGFLSSFMGGQGDPARAGNGTGRATE
jgi:hypothetical protein